MEKKLYIAYTYQDNEKNFFDVIFCVQGQELYAHRDILAFASPVFRKTFNDNRSKGNGPIQINDYTYDEFYEFLRFIYSPNKKYDLDEYDTLFVLIELAYNYRIDEIKEKLGNELADLGGFDACDDEMEDDEAEDIFEKFEFAYKYYLSKFKKSKWLKNFLKTHLSTLIEYDGFIKLDGSAVGAFIDYVEEKCSENQKEKLYEAVIKWAKHQAMVTVEMPEEEKKEVIFHQIKDILPFFSLEFLQQFFVNKGMISLDEANEYKTIKITIKSNDQSITGSFIDDYGIYEYLSSHKNDNVSDDDELIYGNAQRRLWYKKFKIPSTPSTIQKTESARWYLLFDKDGCLFIKNSNLIVETDYLLAQMKENRKKSSYGYFQIFHCYDFYATVSRQK